VVFPQTIVLYVKIAMQTYKELIIDVSFWRHQITNSRKQNYSLYCIFKKSYKLEEYLNTIKDPSQIRTFAKF
jgi:hypothetical protein